MFPEDDFYDEYNPEERVEHPHMIKRGRAGMVMSGPEGSTRPLVVFDVNRYGTRMHFKFFLANRRHHNFIKISWWKLQCSLWVSLDRSRNKNQKRCLWKNWNSKLETRKHAQTHTHIHTHMHTTKTLLEVKNRKA